MYTINSKYKRLITRVLSGEAAATEKEELDLWLARSGTHRRLYEQYKTIWELEPKAPVQTEFNTQQALHNVLRNIEVAEKVAKHGIQSESRFFVSSPQKLYWVSGVAAAFLILITTSLFFFLRSPQAEMLALVADQGDAIITLDDESRVHLRAGASLFYPKAFNENKRPVRLAGSAFFEIKKDQHSTFVISTDHAIIEVLGTSFYLDAGDDHLSVYVSEGMVRLQSLGKNGPEATISKGESAILIYDHQKIQKREFDNMNFLAWKTGKLEFNNEELYEVFMVLEEVYKIEVNAPESVMSMKLTARFQDETPEDILKSIGLVFGFDMSVNKDEYTIHFENSDTQ